MNTYYSPHTGEHIATEEPADWMGSTTTPPPDYDPVTHGCFWRGEYWELVAGTPAGPTAAEIQAAFVGLIQQRLDDFARTRNYDSILSACTYVASTATKFNSEGLACVSLRDATWSAAYDILAQVQAGTRPIPASIADIEADLPPLVWPA